MPRANRHFLPGHAWHLTHRCHDRRFLLRFAQDRNSWISWLFEARRRYGLTVLNYVVTSNHIHLLVYADGDGMTVPRALQLVAGRVAQEFNDRKRRGGAFWQDRYHATAVETGEHLRRCMRYIDLNMVRAGVVTDPADWEWSGYREIQSGRLRYRRIDLETTARLLGLDAAAEVGPWQRRSVWESLERRTDLERRCEWTESIAVGGESYLQAVQNALSFAVRDRQVTPFGEDAFALRESAGPYRPDNTGEIPPLSLPNALRWRLSR